MKKELEKIEDWIKEFFEKYHYQSSVELLLKSPNYFQTYGVTIGIKDFIRQFIYKERNQAAEFYFKALQDRDAYWFKKLSDSFGLTIKDLPAFPKKDLDIFGLITTIGLAKKEKQIKQDYDSYRLKKIEDLIISNEKTIKKSFSTNEKRYPMGWNACLREIKKRLLK